MRLAWFVLALAALPTTMAQAQGQTQAFVSLPHAVDLQIGDNDIGMRVVAQLICDPALSGPTPLQVVLFYGAQGPDDGQGPAWQFMQTSWNLTWSRDGGNYSIDETIVVPVHAAGYGEGGVADEFSIGIPGLRNASNTICTPTGYAVPARSGHAHIQVGARPVASKDAPGLAMPLLAMAFLILARRRA